MKFTIALFAFSLLCSPAYAYLDPGTGSMVVQMAIAGILSVTFAVKMYWYKIKSFITGQKIEELDDLDSDDESDTQK